MNSFFTQFSTDKYRWIALVFLSLGLAIVIIDNTVLNVAIPYILRDLKTSFDAIQWVISGYALIIATLLITMGRLGDLFGRKRIFILGTLFFALGSFLASISPNIYFLFIGESLIEAIGAAMMLTSTLSLLASEFQGKERAIAFGVWGSVAGASATIGPLLGGYLTTYYSWRWSLRINVIVALIAIIGSVFIQESKGEGKKQFDILGTVFSGVGLFCLIFGFIEGRKYGWWIPNEVFSIGSVQWPLQTVSIIPFAFLLACITLFLFVFTEISIEKKNGSPLLRMSMFNNRGFSISLITLGIISLSQFGIFVILPIYLQNVLGFDALGTGVALIPTSLAVFICGPLSGFIASKIGPRWIVTIGMFIGTLGIYLIHSTVAINATVWSLTPGFILFGMGIGMTSAQLTNIILSAVPIQHAGEASAANTTMRQVGTSIGIAVIGVILAGTLMTTLNENIQADTNIPQMAKENIIATLKNVSIEGGQQSPIVSHSPLAHTIRDDIHKALVSSSQAALFAAFLASLLGSIASLFIPTTKMNSWKREKT